ncbi:MAG TPA: proline--tRNA ligase [Solirubrobacterales bacterium]|nr:proline--tRNA ligase [Solirubrobacterales bacterium]
MARSPKNKGVSPSRQEDFPAWFQAVVREGEVAELAHVRGCMVIRPWGYAIWELMQAELDRQIKKSGASNAYFPLFIPLSYFEEEAEHVEGFAKEMAVVTHHRLEEDPADPGKLKPGGELTEPLIVRPTSETIIGKSFAKWINSYRDLPLMVNQWANVVRWEMRPRVLLRTTEFLWQEGHTAFASEEEARDNTTEMLEVYRRFADEFLAMPVLTGEKPEEERFPGAVMTLSIEAMMQDGKALQAGTSHYLGQSFAEAAEINFLNREGERELVHTASWGVSTRLLGALIMSHSDDVGLRLPPTVAPRQVVIVPIPRGDDGAAVLEAAETLAREIGELSFQGAEVRAMADLRDREPPDKRWEWTRKGVPLVLELGPRDLKEGVVALRRRDAGDAKPESLERSRVATAIPELLAEIQGSYHRAAVERLASRTREDIADLDGFREWFDTDPSDADAGGFVRAPWSEAPESAELLEDLKVTVRCLPFDQDLAPGATCVLTGKPAVTEAIFAKAY